MTDKTAEYFGSPSDNQKASIVRCDHANGCQFTENCEHSKKHPPHFGNGDRECTTRGVCYIKWSLVCCVPAYKTNPDYGRTPYVACEKE